MSKAQSRIAMILGSAGTVAWLGLALCWTFRGGVPNLELNEWGDWAAGISAPLAFLWLVLGYMQQGAEITQNTAELARSVDAQNRLVAAAERQAIAAGLAASSGALATVLTFQPIVTILNFAADPLTLNLRNDGRNCYQVKVRTLGGADYKIQPDALEAWAPGSHQVFYFDAPAGDLVFDFAFDYMDVLGNRQTQEFHFERSHTAGLGLLILECYPKALVPNLGGRPLTLN